MPLPWEMVEVARAAAEEIRKGSLWAWVLRVWWRMRRKLGLEVTEEGVGGLAVVVPIAREPLGGDVGRKVRRCVVGCVGWGKM
jgi:hypothetical protein